VSSLERGPAYTEPTKRDPDAPAKTFGEDQFNKQYGGNSKADIDPFIAVETYSSKYKPKKKTLPDIKNMKLDKNLFPKELWGTLSDSEGEEVREDLARIAKRKAAVIGGLKGTAKGTTDRSAAERNAIVLEKIKQATGGEEDGEEVEEDEISNVSEHDDDYEDEEDGGDYDAEAYFDDGEKEEDEGEVGGGEDY
jgi:DNA-directed RNA polymerase III subunit RPC7